jgi:hypothetical protein
MYIISILIYFIRRQRFLRNAVVTMSLHNADSDILSGESQEYARNSLFPWRYLEDGNAASPDVHLFTIVLRLSDKKRKYRTPLKTATEAAVSLIVLQQLRNRLLLQRELEICPMFLVEV